MKKQYLSALLIAALTAITFTSCDKDSDEEEMCNTSIETGNSVMLEFDFEMGDTDFEYNTVYDMGGVNVSFTEIRFYVADLMVHNDDGDMDMLDKTILVDAGSEANYAVGRTEHNHIHELHFLVGLNDVVNHEDPTLAEAPLNDASMHWGWDPASGYKFIKTEVLVDMDADGVPETAMSIHCATDGLSREVMLGAHQDVEGETALIQLTVDVAAVYAGVDFMNLEGTHGNSDLTNAVADNLAGAIVIQ